MRTLRELRHDRRPWIIAHRGYSARCPENTLAACDAAIEAGADVIELDVRHTADRFPVVFHDETLDRTTSGSGRVDETSAERILSLDAGSWFAPRFAGERVPLLEDVLRHVSGRCCVNLELKPEGFDARVRPDSIEVQALMTVQTLGLEDSVFLSSFEHRFAERLARARSRIPFALLYEGPLDAEAAAERARALGALAVHAEAAELRREDVALLAERRVPVSPYTVDDTETMQRLLAWGVQGLITNDPATLSRVLAGRTERTS